MKEKSKCHGEKFMSPEEYNLPNACVLFGFHISDFSLLFQL